MNDGIRNPAILISAVLVAVAAVQSPDTVAPWAVNAIPEAQQHAVVLTRGPTDEKKLALVFTGHEFAEGASTILDALALGKARASFFLTGDFLATPEFGPLVRRMIVEGHYLGPHSDKHLLYCSWDASRKLLVTRAQFSADLEANLAKIERLGAKRSAIPYFLPPYEHYNQQIADWTSEMGLTLINFTPGTRSNADYTEDGDTNFVSSQVIYDSIVKRESDDPRGLNGFLLLLHIGAGPRRTDKFHARFSALLEYLSSKGYRFVRVDELLQGK